MEKVQEKKYKSLRARLILWGILLSLVISFSFGFVLFNVASSMFFSNFLKNKFALVKIIAASIDGDIHAGLVGEDDIESMEYTRYLDFLHYIYNNEDYITWLYTVNYNESDGKFYYCLDAEVTKSEYIWVESEVFSVYFYVNDQGKIILVYDDDEFEDSFTISKDNVEYKIDITGRKIFLNGTELCEIISYDPFKVKVRDYILDIKNYSIDEELFWTVGDDELKIVISLSGAGEPLSFPGDIYVDSEEDIELMRELVLNGQDYIEKQPHVSSYGNLLSAFAVIKNSEDKGIGLVGLDVNTKEIEAFKNSIGMIAILISIVTLIIIFIVVLIFARSILLPLEKLSSTVNTVSKGNLDIKIQLERDDEFELLADRFNGMVINIKDARNKLTRTNEAYYRFVPKEFLELLNKDEITNVQRGNVSEKRLTILFSDIRSFTSISENMTPNESFNFLNSYLGFVGPKIRMNNGFIDKYIGDAIMALFTKSDNDGLNAALDMFRGLIDFNNLFKKKGFEPISIGIGLHSGEVMLGIIGEENRIEGTVISDTVNLASRVEGLTKYYNALILITSDVLQSITYRDSLAYRYIGKVKVSGKERMTELYEVIIPEFDSVERLKLETKTIYEKGVSLFYNKQLEKADNHFAGVLEQNPDDKVSFVYRQRIKRYMKHELPEDWDGVDERVPK